LNKNTSTGGIPYADKLGTAGINPLPVSDAVVVLDGDHDRVTLDPLYRVAIHESGHIVAGRAAGMPVDGATVDPAIAGPGLAGRAWGPHARNCKLLAEMSDVPLCEQVRPLMPTCGEDKTAAAEIYAAAHARTVELLAGVEAERLFNQTPGPATYDMQQAQAFANLVASTSKSAAAFLDFARCEAAEVLAGHRTSVEAIAAALVERKTLNGVEIDQIIHAAEARDALIAEQVRRERWRQCASNANMFENWLTADL
jgi:hypothetical protein